MLDDEEGSEIEDAWVKLSVALYHLQKAGRYKDAYEEAGFIIDLLRQDRVIMEVLHSDKIYS